VAAVVREALLRWHGRVEPDDELKGFASGDVVLGFRTAFPTILRPVARRSCCARRRGLAEVCAAIRRRSGRARVWRGRRDDAGGGRPPAARARRTLAVAESAPAVCWLRSSRRCRGVLVFGAASSPTRTRRSAAAGRLERCSPSTERCRTRCGGGRGRASGRPRRRHHGHPGRTGTRRSPWVRHVALARAEARPPRAT
jgi:hypothetical protein